MSNFRLLFVLAKAHSGSTLLGRILDMHSDVMCVGEMLRFEDAIKKGVPCSCGSKLEECDFWHRHIPLINGYGKMQYKSFSQKLFEEIGASNGKKIVIDLSKTRVLRLMDGIFHARKRNFKETGFILLVRDPRGLSASAKRRSGLPLKPFLSNLSKWMKRFQKFSDRYHDRSLIMYYENLCRNPEHEIKRACHFMKIEFEPGMHSPADKIHHFVHSSTSNYLKNVNKILLDERWRTELLHEEIAQIETVINNVPILKTAYSGF